MKKLITIISSCVILAIVAIVVLRAYNFKFFPDKITTRTTAEFKSFEKTDQLFTEFTSVDIPLIAFPNPIFPPKGYDDFFKFLAQADLTDESHIDVLKELAKNDPQTSLEIWARYVYELQNIHEFSSHDYSAYRFNKKALPFMFERISVLFPEIKPYFFCFQSYEVSFGYNDTSELIDKYKHDVCSGNIEVLPPPQILSSKAVGESLMGTSVERMVSEAKTSCQGWDRKLEQSFLNFETDEEIPVDRKSHYLVHQKLKDDNVLDDIHESSKRKLAVFIGVYCD